MDSSPSLPATTPARAMPVLVLQGGGALGSYQAGAYQALCHHDFEPEWVAGISIGAINAAIIAGNAPEKRVDRLKEFWEQCASPVPWNPILKSERGRTAFNEASAAIIATFGVPGFFTPRIPPAPLWPHGSPQAESYYDTSPLKKTLERLVDFDRINDLHCRLSVGAVGVSSGNFRYFDNVEFRRQGKQIGPEHIMASGALPPGFPAVMIEGEHYWDGGISSNTPLEAVLDDRPRRNSLIFSVNMWQPSGPAPETIWRVPGRQKEIRYASRGLSHVLRQQQLHRLRHVIRELAKRLPKKEREHPYVRELASYGCETTMHLIRLLAPRLDDEDHTK